MLRSSMFAAATLASASLSLAAAITIPNASFEAGTGYGGTWGGEPASWNRGQSLGDLSHSTVLQAANDTKFTGKDLNNYLSMNVDGGQAVVPDVTTTNSVWTSSLGTYAPGTTYTLTVALATEYGSANRSAIISLLADGTAVQSRTTAFTDLPHAAFSDFSITLDTGAMSGIVGQNISVMVTHSLANERYGKSLAVDNVRLDASAVPEPATLGILASAGTLALRRRRCH